MFKGKGKVVFIFGLLFGMVLMSPFGDQVINVLGGVVDPAGGHWMRTGDDGGTLYTNVSGDKLVIKDTITTTAIDTGQGVLEVYEVLPAWMVNWNTSFGWGDHPNQVGDGDPFFNASDAFPLTAAWMAGWNSSDSDPADPFFNASDASWFSGSMSSGWNSTGWVDQDVNSTGNPTFATLDTGQGALELYEVLPAWMSGWNNTIGDGDPFFNASDAFPLTAAWMAGWNASGVGLWNRSESVDTIYPFYGDSKVTVNGTVDADNFTVTGGSGKLAIFQHPESNNFIFSSLDSDDSMEFRGNPANPTVFYNNVQLSDGKAIIIVEDGGFDFLQLWHDGSNGIIRCTTQVKLYSGTNLNVNSNDVYGIGTLSLDNYEFPSADGSADQVLKTDGSGTLLWQPDNGTGGSGGNPFDQDLNTSDLNPAWFVGWNSTGNPFDADWNLTDLNPLWFVGWNSTSNPFDQELNKSSSVVFDTVNVSNHIHLDKGSAMWGANDSDQTLLVTPGGKDTQVFAFSSYDSETGLKFDTSNYNGIVFNFQGTDIAFWNIAGADAGDMTVTDGAGDFMHYDNSLNSIHVKDSVAGGDTDTNYTSDGTGVDTGGTAFYSTQYTSARHTFEGGAGGGYQWSGATGSPLALIQIVGGEVQGFTGFKIDDVVGDWIDDSSHVGGSNAMFIGNQQITTSSDRRIKKNIVDTEVDALNVIEQLSDKVVDFEWDDPNDRAIDGKLSRGVFTGMIAQDIVDIVPWIVHAPRNLTNLEIDYMSEQIWNVEYQHLVPVLVKAIQEQQDIIDSQDERMDDLESRFDRLERNPFVRMFR